jgi:hypothetical protein
MVLLMYPRLSSEHALYDHESNPGMETVDG